MNERVKHELDNRFGERARFDRNERLIYSRDVGNLPDVVEMMLDNLADAVVQPESLDDLVFLAKLAGREGLPVVPRGAATSGYGGSVPAKAGIVVAFRRMNHILSVDRRDLTVTVEPGVIWARLEESLKAEGLALRLYPTSAPGSTVGGWVGEGGSGIGSYEFGFIADNVVSAKLVTPSGEVRTLTGADLDLVNRAEGTTGFIAEVTLKLRRLEDETVMVAAFSDLSKLVGAVEEAGRRNLPIWHVSFNTAQFLKTKEEAEQAAEAEDTVEGHSTGLIRPGIPTGKHLAMFVFPAPRNAAVVPALKEIVAAAGGDWLDEKAARHEWNERFYPMRLKRIGPSLIPSEAIVPLKTVAKVIEEGARRLEGISIEGSLVGKGEVALLCFLLHDQRTWAYTAGFAKSLIMMDISKKHGGRAYSVGLYFTDEAGEAFGPERLRRLKSAKAELDPKNIFNPGKLIAGHGNPVLLRTAMKAARAGQSLVPLAEKFLSDRPHMKRRLAEKLTNAAFACAGCGYCVDNCTLHFGVGWESASPRGKWSFLRDYLRGKAQLDQPMVNNFLMCTTCKKCNPVCMVHLPIQELWDQIRPVLIQDLEQATFPAFEMMSASLKTDLNIWAASREERDAWVPEDVRPVIKDKAPVAYWAGCTASFVESEIAENAVRILKDGGVDFTYLGQDEACCGVPMAVAGLTPEYEMVVKHNLTEMNKRGVKEIVVSCPGCWVGWTHYYPATAKKLGIPYDIKIRHITEVTNELIQQGKLQFKKPINKTISWHDSCHIGRHGGIYEPPREALKAIPGVEYVDCPTNRADGKCCGSVLTRISDFSVSDRIVADRLDEALGVGAEVLATTCPCCEFQLRVGGDSTGRDLPIIDFSALVAEALGYEVRNTTENTLYMWGVFKKAIEIMSSDGIVKMMGDMMPEIMKAMPGTMQGMMNGVAAMPKVIKNPTLGAMEKMIPMLMPMLFPGMMPKLMPKVLELMKKEIPDMPPDMEKNLPNMLPVVMGRIMPGMLAEVAPRLAPKMVEYLKGENVAD
ncbi:MAG: FAD-binding and (Fe-S)-binding domain-containing protein [Bacillota bacterium]